MKIFTKLSGIIAITAVIAAGLSACITIGKPQPPDPETLALRNALYNATWEKRAFDEQPSLSGFEKLSFSNTEYQFFQSAAIDEESADGREGTISHNGVKSTYKRIYMAPNTWYALRSPDFPGKIYYYYSQSRGALSVISVYKGAE